MGKISLNNRETGYLISLISANKIIFLIFKVRNWRNYRETTFNFMTLENHQIKILRKIKLKQKYI